MKIVFNPSVRGKVIGDMGKTLVKLIDNCEGANNCRKCEDREACLNLFKLSDEFISIGEKSNEE